MSRSNSLIDSSSFCISSISNLVGSIVVSTLLGSIVLCYYVSPLVFGYLLMCSILISSIYYINQCYYFILLYFVLIVINFRIINYNISPLLNSSFSSLCLYCSICICSNSYLINHYPLCLYY